MREQLLEFRSRYRPRMFELDWSYYLLGHGPECILFLHGAIGNGESYFEYMTALEGSFRLLAPNVPPVVSKVSEVLNGVVDILDAERIDKVHVFGHSQGGLIAQALVRVFPERARSMMLSNTALPSETHARKIESQLRILRLFPEPLIRLAMRTQIARVLRTDAPELSAEGRTFWREYLRDQLAGAGARELALSAIRIQLDYHQQLVFTRNDLADWPGRVLIFDSDRDTLIAPEESAALRAMYPEACVRTFHGSGHLSLITQVPEYVSEIRKFVG